MTQILNTQPLDEKAYNDTCDLLLSFKGSTTKEDNLRIILDDMGPEHKFFEDICKDFCVLGHYNDYLKNVNNVIAQMKSGGLTKTDAERTINTILASDRNPLIKKANAVFASIYNRTG